LTDAVIADKIAALSARLKGGCFTGPRPFVCLLNGAIMAEENLEAQPTPSAETDPAVETAADRVDLQSSATGSIDADSVEMHASAALRIEADTVRMVQSRAFMARTETLAVEQSSVGVLRATEATLADSSVFALIGDRVQAANVNTLWLIANNVEGEVKAVIDPRSAVLLGATFGGVFGLLALISSVLRRR
jgi:hypothetical protein